MLWAHMDRLLQLGFLYSACKAARLYNWPYMDPIDPISIAII